uniref:Uncharacterized protein n=1 Tax=Cucumis melo TaxID=3656 RepID=A0A9I9EGL2_CUCME
MKTQSSPSEIRLLRSRKLDPLSLPSVHTQLFSWRENKDGDGVNSGCERIELRSHGLLVRKAFMAGRSLLSSCFSIHCLESVSAQGHSARPSFSQCRPKNLFGLQCHHHSKKILLIALLKILTLFHSQNFLEDEMEAMFLFVFSMKWCNVFLIYTEKFFGKKKKFFRTKKLRTTKLRPEKELFQTYRSPSNQSRMVRASLVPGNVALTS